ncbi:MAG: hypothetical protein [Olavius algarvensis Delta 4 endosymbiont]|nr:MAG: hypothetical protein [Olavius algarvensis Delta 4 endosymbiont]
MERELQEIPLKYEPYHLQGPKEICQAKKKPQPLKVGAFLK